MNTLLYDLTEWCKEMNMKDFRDYIGTTDWKMYRSRDKKSINTKENIIKLNEWLEYKIKDLIRYKKRAEKLLAECK